MHSDRFAKVISNVHQGQQLSETAASECLAELQHLSKDQQLLYVAELYRSVAPYLNWHKFTGQPRTTRTCRILKSLRSRLEAKLGKLDEQPRPPSTRSTEYDEGRLKARIRKAESAFGFSQNLLQDVLTSLGSSDGIDRHPASFTAHLSHVLFDESDSLPTDDYDPQLHRLIHDSLVLIGVSGRQNQHFVKIAGKAIYQLFPNDPCGVEGDSLFLQCCYRADDYLKDHPSDLFALLWRGELACWQGDLRTVKNCAQDFWTLSGHCDPEQVEQIVWFFADLSNYAAQTEIDWTSPATPALDLGIGYFEDNWLGAIAPLDESFIRRAFDAGTWDTPFIAACAALDAEVGMPDDILPCKLWAWLAERPKTDTVMYYQYWERAFLTSDNFVPNDSVSFLSSCVLALGHIVHADLWSAKTNLRRIMARVVELAGSPKWSELAVKCIQTAHLLISQKEKRGTRLRAADRLAVHEALAIVAVSNRNSSRAQGPQEDLLISYGSVDRPEFMEKAEQNSFVKRRRSLEWEKMSAEELLASGETNYCEFKPTLKKPLKSDTNFNKADRRMEHECLKTICGFLNSGFGGVLLIGVDNNGHPIGVEADVFENEDKMSQHLSSLIRTHIGSEFTSNIEIQFESARNKRVLVVKCWPSKFPVWLRMNKPEEFFNRVGATTHQIDPSRVAFYWQNRESRNS